jgi:hypothetical protein
LESPQTYSRRSRILAGVVVASILGLATFSVLQNIQPEGNQPDYAPAHRFTANPAVRINYKKKTFFGRIASRRARCRRNRRVTLIKARRGISDLIVARTRTGRRGRWRVERRRRPHGRFYARIYRRVPRSYGHVHRCRADESRRLRIR